MDEELKRLLESATVKVTAVDGQDVLVLTVEQGTAPAVWQRLRDAHAETGLWPFLVDADEDKPYHQPVVWDHIEDGQDDEEPRSAETLFSIVPELDEDDEEDVEYLANLMSGEADLSGPPAPGKLSESQTTNIGLVRTAAGGWDIPRLLQWDGAANHGITGAEHSNVLKYWHERYGAELAVATFDVLELLVANPPTERAEIEAVTLAQYHYCVDVVDQGVGTLAALAQKQVHTHHWYFWWD